MPYDSVKQKLIQAARIDLSLKIVWKASPKLTIAGALAIFLSGLLPLASIYLIKLIIDAVADATPIATLSFSNREFSKIIAYLIGAGILVLMTNFVNNLIQYIQKAQTLKVTDYVYSIIHEQSCKVDLSFYESAKNRDTLFRAQQDGPYRPTSIVNGLFTSGQNIVSLVGAISLLFTFNPIFPLLILISGIPGIFFRLRHSANIYSWQKKNTQKERKAFYLHWILTQGFHAQELRLFQLGTHFSRQFSSIMKHLLNNKLAYEKKRISGDMIAQAWGAICLFAVLTQIAVYTLKGLISIGDMVLYFQLFQKGTGFFKTLLETIAHMHEDNLFLSNLFEFLSITPQVNCPEKPVQLPEKIQTGIRFENVSFSYNCQEGSAFLKPHTLPTINNQDNSKDYGKDNINNEKGKKILENINFSLKPGKITALAGENGSGKSTIVKLLARMYDPQKGSIYLDNIDIRKFDPQRYQKKISAVFQEHMHYFLSAKENIVIGDLSESENFQKMKDAAQNSGIHKIIQTLPHQYETIVGNWFTGSHELSKGQWQMLAIARNFFRNAEIIILDEPSSSLDPIVQSMFFSNLRQIARGYPTLLISHKYSNLKMADKILFLENGRIVEEGNHYELIKMNKKYAALYKLETEEYK